MSTGLARSSLWTACHSSSMTIWMSSCQMRSAVPTRNAASSNALHAAARGVPRDTGGAAASCAAVNARSSRGEGRAIHDRVQSQLVSRREDPRMREPGAPQHVLRAHPQHAKAVDDRMAEVDFARVVEILRRTRNFADPHAEG